MTLLVLSDGRGARMASWALRVLVRYAAVELRAGVEHEGLAERLGHRLSSVELRGHLDTRSLLRSEQVALESAMLLAVGRLRGGPPADWHDPAAFAGFLALMERVAAMVESIRRGEPPAALNELAAVVTGAPMPLGHDVPEDAS
jgi:hypothetical protein